MGEETTNNQHQQEEAKNKPRSVSSIRTYKTDLIDISQNEDQSLAQLVLKAQERKRKEGYTRELLEKDKVSNKKALYTSIITVLLAILIITTAYLVVKKPGLSNLSMQIIGAPIISDTYHNFSANIISQDTFANDVSTYLSTATINKGTIEHFYITNEIVTNPKKEINVISAQSFLKLWTNSVPSLLSRSLDPESYIFGVHARLSDGGQSRFMIFKTNFFDSTYAGMLSWETNMFFDLQELFNLDFSIEKNKFTDELLMNKDVRILKSIEDETLLIYTFADQQTLVIADNAETFRALINRLELPVPIVN